MLTMLNIWNKENVAKTGASDSEPKIVLPYEIRNRTGGPIYVWSTLDGSTTNNTTQKKIADGGSEPWRFDDWKTMREVSGFPPLFFTRY